MRVSHCDRSSVETTDFFDHFEKNQGFLRRVAFLSECLGASSSQACPEFAAAGFA